MSDPVSFGYWVRRRRKALDLTQEALAQQIGCAIVTIRKIEADERRPSRQIAERLAACLDLPSADRAAFLQAARAEVAVDRLAPAPAPAIIPPERRSHAPLRMQTLKGYILREPIGAGGFGVVYRAEQPEIGRDVAIKIILPVYADQPQFIRRFEAEAHLIARLEHPHIVPLYDYWRDQSGAYLVMRYMAGGSLRAALSAGAWSLEHTTQLLIPIAAALACAHRHGVVHRDLKPANILLDKAGNAYLADFGIAKDVLHATPDTTQPGIIVGSLEYLSPEQIRDEPITPQTDLYALGVLLYEMICGTHPFAESSPTERLAKQLNVPLPPLSTHGIDHAIELDHVIQRATAKHPADRYATVEQVVEAWQRALLSHPASIAQSQGVANGRQLPLDDQTTLADLPNLENPYKGLRAFAEADAADFFGRAALTARLLERLAEEIPLARFLAVVGPSGSGKSSVVRAGLIPTLRQGGLPGSEQWFIAELIPGAHPLEELELALLKVALRAPVGLAEQLQRDARGLLRAARLILPDDDSELVLLIDQFEEIFTLVADEAARAHMLDSLIAAVADERSRVRVIVTLRADFYDRPLHYPALGELMRARTEVVLPLNLDELEQAIALPARRAGVTTEPELVADVMHDVGTQPGALPLLQYALTELFERRDGYVLTRAAYRASGGVRGALARRAEQLFQGLAPIEQVAAREIFLRLVTLGEGVEDTRRRVLRSELAPLTDAGIEAGGNGIDRSSAILRPMAAVDAVLDAYGKHRLLTFDHDPLSRAPTVEVAHEALIREWPRLRAWLEAGRSALRVHRLLAAAAAEWQESSQDADFLATGARLGQFTTLLARGSEPMNGERASSSIALNAAERTYLDASIAARDRQEQAERERQARELKHVQALAETEQRRADEQSRAASRLRRRALLLAGVLVLALIAAGAAGILAQNNATLATQNAASAETAEAAGRQANTERATAVAESQLRATQQAIAQTNFVTSERQRLTAEAAGLLDRSENGDLAALLAIRSLRITYSPQADATLLHALTFGFPRHIFTGTDQIADVAFSPDGKQVLTSAGQTAQLWDLASGQQLRKFKGHTGGGVWGVAFSPDGKQVLTSGTDDGTARLWDAASGQQLREFNVGSELRGVVFSPDGRWILTTGGDGIARLWDAASGQIVREFKGHTDEVSDVISDEVSGVAFSPDGKQVLTGSFDHTARLWDTATGQELREFKGHTDFIQDVAFSPDGHTVATSSNDYTARLWDVATGKQLHIFSGHTGGVAGVAFSPDGHSLLTTSEDHTARLWDIVTGQELRQFLGHTNTVVRGVFSPDGRYVLTGSNDDTARLWDTRPNVEPRVFVGPHGAVYDVAFSPDGTQMVYGGDDGRVWLRDVATGQLVHLFEGHTDTVYWITFSPDGKQVLTSSVDKTARLWDVASGQILRVFSGHTDEVQGVAFSPDGKQVLTGSLDKTVRLWDVASGQTLQVFTGHTDQVHGVAFSPDGKSILTASADKTVRLWDVATGQTLRVYTGHTGAIINVAFSRDGTQMLTASADKTARLWDVASGRTIQVFTGHSDVVIAAVFSPDGKQVLTSSQDATARLWDVATGQTVRVFTGHTEGLYGAAISPDGRFILTASSDRTARLWRINEGDVIRFACAQLPRDFTPAERAIYTITDNTPTCVLH